MSNPFTWIFITKGLIGCISFAYLTFYCSWAPVHLLAILLTTWHIHFMFPGSYPFLGDPFIFVVVASVAACFRSIVQHDLGPSIPV